MASSETPHWRTSGEFWLPWPYPMHQINYFSYRNFTTRSQSGTFSLLQTLVFYIKTKNTQKKRVSYMKKMLEGEGGVFNKNLGVRTPVTSPANWCMWPVTLHLNWTGLLQGTKTKNQNFENTHLHTSPRFWTFKKKKKKKKKMCCQQHPVFPGGHPSKY